ncbi:YdcF family protein [Clostridium sp. C8-1-8]|uniref:YdcF family protein n=1 Tax=Clostridium sp. C8-1-8 TaxID=2698831 RepID=UPI00136E6E49|nr:YdcF family protein [Clostridium sp. C8-1-8]
MDYPFDCISEFIFAESEIKKSDVILIPGASQHQLMERAVELYKSGFAKYILPSGGPNFKLPNNKSEWDYLKAIGINLGIPENSILKEDKAQNTFENAKFSWNVLQSLDMQIESVILVCKAYHARRALLTYKSVFPSSVNFYISPIIDKRGISKDNWFLNEDSIRIVMNEVVKIGSYFEDKINKLV